MSFGRPSRRSRAGRAAVRLIPSVWLALFVAVPALIVLRISLSESALAQPPYRPLFPATLRPGALLDFLAGLGLDSYATLLSDALYRDALLWSLALAAVSTALAVPAGYAIALAIVRAPRRCRPMLLALVLLPFWTSFLIRIYAWIAILKPDGWLNHLLVGTGLAERPLDILNSNTAVLIGMVYGYLPFAILPIYAALDRQDRSLVEAALDLGAGRLRAFWTVTVPLSGPGVVAAALLCFVPMVGEFVIPDLLGGSDTLMLGRTLWLEFFSNRDWPLAAAVAIAMGAILVPPVLVLRRFEETRLQASR